jgi:preprotein translocase subunit SecD
MKLLKNVRIIILLLALILAVAAINPRPWQDGVAIRSVEKDSAAADAGISTPSPKTTPVLRERIIAINEVPIHNEADYDAYVNALEPNVTIRVQTNKQAFVLVTRPQVEYEELKEKETVAITTEVFNEETDRFENKTENVTRNKRVAHVIGTQPIGLSVYDAPKTNIRYGLDISGGARVLLQPDEPVTQDQMDVIIDTIKERLNVYGMSDIVVRPVSDLSGAQFILIEIAGASEKDVRELVLSQGKFEAKIGNETVFSGGKDITYVCRSPECSGLSMQGCQQGSDGMFCQFQFEITMTPEAAERQAAITRNLEVVSRPDGQLYLERPLDLYLDDALVDSLQIGSSLKGSAVTTISISGSGTGANQRAAADDALANMKKLQTVLVTGSLPVKLHVVKTDTISAELGDEFIRNALFVGLLAFAAVTVLMMIRFRDLKISVPVIITLLSELIIILGFAAAFKSNLDLAAIAGILVAIGTGVDDQIVIADETIGDKKKKQVASSWKDKLGKAFFIIFAAYATAMASMIPLLWAGAGLVRGFAIMTMAGITIGVLITRPAFAVIMEKLETDE